MSLSNKQIFEKANAAVTAGDNEGFLVHCTEDTVRNFVGDQTLQGKEAVRQYMAKTYVEPPQFDVQHLIAEDDFVIAVGKISMKNEAGTTINYSYTDVNNLSIISC